MDKLSLNYLFYYMVLYTPVAYWAAYFLGLKKQLESAAVWLSGKASHGKLLSLKRILFLWVYGNFGCYVGIGVFVALIQTFIGFTGVYDIQSKTFIAEVAKDSFKVSLFILVIVFFAQARIRAESAAIQVSGSGSSQPNIGSPKELGKLRYMQYSDIATQLNSVRWRLLVPFVPLVFLGGMVPVVGFISCLLGLFSCPWYYWLVLSLFSTMFVWWLYDLIPDLLWLRVGVVCDRGVGYIWFKQNGDKVRAKWYAFNEQTYIREKQTINGRTWRMRPQLYIGFYEGDKQYFVISYLKGYDDESSMQLLNYAEDRFRTWQRRRARSSQSSAP